MSSILVIKNKMKIFKFFGFIFLLFFILFSAWQFIEAVYRIALNHTLYLWFGGGVVAYAILRRFGFFSKNVEWFEIHTHEWLHIVVALMFGQKIHSISAGEKGGMMYHSGRFNRNIFISLAPYCLPLYAYFFCILRLLGERRNFYIFDLMIGFTLTFHILCFKKQTSSHQTDIRQFGVMLSYLFITAFLLFNVTVILNAVKIGITDAFIYQFKHYWHDADALYNYLKQHSSIKQLIN